MSAMSYSAPSTISEAVSLLANAGGLAKIMSGGTDLLVQMKSGRVKPAMVIDTKRIPGSIGIREVDGGFVIGAATPGAMLGEHAGLVKAWPGVVEGANLIGPRPDRRPRHRTDRRPRRHAGSAGGKHRHRPRPHQPRQGRIHR